MYVYHHDISLNLKSYLQCPIDVTYIFCHYMPILCSESQQESVARIQLTTCEHIQPDKKKNNGKNNSGLLLADIKQKTCCRYTGRVVMSFQYLCLPQSQFLALEYHALAHSELILVWQCSKVFMNYCYILAIINGLTFP